MVADSPHVLEVNDATVAEAASALKQALSEPRDAIGLNLDFGLTRASVRQLRALLECARAAAEANPKLGLSLDGRDEVMRLVGVFSDGLFCGPETVQLNLTNACNLDCLFCWNHSGLVSPPQPAEWKRQRMASELFHSLIEDLATMRAGHLLFSGRGEPFAHPQAWEFVDAVTRAGLPATIETNLLLVNDIERLRDSSVTLLIVNISAGTPQGYSRVHPRQKRDAFAALRRKLARLEAAGQAAPQVVPVFVIFAENFREIPAMVELSAEVGAKRAYFKMMEVADRLPDVSVPVSARPELAERIEEGHRAGERLQLETNLASLEYQFKSEKTATFSKELYKEIGCYMGWYYLRIAIDGRVFFCCKDMLVGQVSPSRRLGGLWRSHKYQAFRQLAREMDFERGKGFLGPKCFQCSNFEQNRRIAALLA